MKSRWENASCVRIGFLDPTEFLTVYTGELMQGRLNVMGATGAATGSEAVLVLEFPANGDEVELKAKIASVRPGPPPAATLELLPLPDEIRKGIESYMTEVLRGEAPPVRFRQTEVTATEGEFDKEFTEEADETAADAADEKVKERKRVTMVDRLKEMTVLDKIKLSLISAKEVRQFLFRDPAAHVLIPYLLKNQRITTEEITRIAGDPTASVEAIRIISMNTNWMYDATIKGKIIRNPKTNIDTAVRLVKQLPLGEIRSIADSTAVRGALQKAARQVLKDKGMIS